MITIICGEDIVESRRKFVDLEAEFLKKNYQIRKLDYNELSEINKWSGESASLFADKQVFFTQDVNRKIRRTDKTVLAEIERLSSNKNIELVIWEQLSGRELKFAKLATVLEFKPKDSIFKMLDGLYPGNLNGFLSSLHEISNGKNDQFIFIMLIRHVRLLLLASSNSLGPAIPAWQQGKLKALAKKWKQENLTLLYEALFRLEIAVKTSATPFSVVDSLDILMCHFIS